VKESLSILIAAATEMEWQPTRTYVAEQGKVVNPACFRFGDLVLTFLNTGPGIPDTIYRLTKALNGANRPDLVVHAGIAGAFDQEVLLGTVFAIGSDRFADLGAQTAEDGFLDLFELGLAGSNEIPYQSGQILPIAPNIPLPDLPIASAITVNTVSGTDARISQIHGRYPVDLESMEGAAVLYVCRREEMPVLALRAVSNRVEPRNRDAWEIGRAVTNLNNALCQWLDQLRAWAADR